MSRTNEPFEGTSLFGAYGYISVGVRIGQRTNRRRRATNLWDRREFRDLDETAELGAHTFKPALCGLRRWAREGRLMRSTFPGRTGPLPNTGGSMSSAVRSGETPTRCFSFSMSVAPWTRLWSGWRRSFRRHAASSVGWSTSISKTGTNRVFRVITASAGDEQTATDEILRTYGPNYQVICISDAAK